MNLKYISLLVRSTISLKENKLKKKDEERSNSLTRKNIDSKLEPPSKAPNQRKESVKDKINCESCIEVAESKKHDGL